MVILKTTNLTKEYVSIKRFRKQKCIAINDLNLELSKGEIFAFLGPNGAGKTTTMNILAGVSSPTKGNIEIFGEKFDYSKIEIKKRIGYLPEYLHLPPYYHVGELLNFYSQFFNIAKKKQQQKIDEILESVGILSQKNILIRNLSMGQKRCLGLAIALINEPELILLDEPTVYLDPLVSEKIRFLLLRLKERGCAIFISSHILSEVEKISDRFGIINKGSLIQQGNVTDLTNKGQLEEIFLRLTKQ